MTLGPEVKPPKTQNKLLNEVPTEDAAANRLSNKKHLVKEFGQTKGQLKTGNTSFYKKASC